MNKFSTKVILPHEPLTIDICDKTDREYRHSEVPLDKIHPDMKALLERLGVGILMAEVFFTPPFLKRGIHIDTAIGGDITKLNWIYCEGDNQMNWYEPKPDAPHTISETAVSTNYVSYRESQVNLLHTEKFSNANVIVQVGIPHNVRNLRYPRWALCFTICHLSDRSRITVEQAQSIFKDYIQE
jgi:hypothetical protein